MPHSTLQTEGLLLINLGTPDAPEPKAVGRYLRQFLMDKFVVDIPAFFRFILVNILIVPRRSHSSAHAYQQVWTEKGSPLLFHTRDLTEKVKKRSAIPVEFGMRYGNPSIESALEKLAATGVKKITVLPLYPQYSNAATLSSIEETKRIAREKFHEIELRFIEDFFEAESFIESVCEIAKPKLAEKKFDHVLFSFHGLPERQLKKMDSLKNHCLLANNCCDSVTEKNRMCYRAQCIATARACAKKLGLNSDQYSVSFQSRLGRTPWIQPFSDALYETLPKKGVKRLAVLCPSFTADCLETLEEVAMRGKEQFVAAGGEDLELIPCVNSSDSWADAVLKISAHPMNG